jgi:hypothetical protein
MAVGHSNPADSDLPRHDAEDYPGRVPAYLVSCIRPSPCSRSWVCRIFLRQGILRYALHLSMSRVSVLCVRALITRGMGVSCVRVTRLPAETQ